MIRFNEQSAIRFLKYLHHCCGKIHARASSDMKDLTPVIFSPSFIKDYLKIHLRKIDWKLDEIHRFDGQLINRVLAKWAHQPSSRYNFFCSCWILKWWGNFKTEMLCDLQSQLFQDQLDFADTSWQIECWELLWMF